MQAAADHFIGEHDFASLTRLNHGRESTVRTIHDCTVTALEHDRLHVDVSGNGFLYNMVRVLVGTLVEVGRGRVAVDAVPALLEARDRGHGAMTMPPEGLCLMWIHIESGGHVTVLRSILLCALPDWVSASADWSDWQPWCWNPARDDAASGCTG